MNHLLLEGISKNFANNKVIENLSFAIEKDEFVSIIGPSGSGKSTIFHLIGGLLSPDKGKITLEEELINGKRGFISYMPQTPSLLPWRTVLENVLLGQELKGVKNEEKAREMLNIAGLSDYEKSFPHELSGGMKQRVAFVRALLSPQPIILLDEPFSALDELTRFEMQRWLLSIWEGNKRTILFITHNIEEALFLSDRILVLSNKPAHIISNKMVPFPRPRKQEVLLTETFLEEKRSIYATLTGNGN